MKYSSALVASFAASAMAFPHMSKMTKEDLEDLVKRYPAPEANPEPQVLGAVGTTVGSLGSTVAGLLGSVAASVDPANKRPEPGYTFIAPGPNDSRGPCPGLNLLANYGYLPRNGHVTFGEVLTAVSRGFNMDADVAAVLSVFAVITDGDIATESWYLGAGPGDVGGLNRHSTVEADISPNREDYYNGCGDNHHLSSRLFKQNVGYAAASASKQFDINVMGSQYAQTASFSKANNPYLYYFPFPMIVSLGAFAFYPNFFSNGTYGAGGVANYESISSIIGANLTSKGEYEYIPERWPENWYRRATPYGAVDTLIDGYTKIYPRNLVVPAIPQLGTGNLNVTTLLCDAYMGLNSIIPLFVAGDAATQAAAVTWALSKLDPYFKNTLLGCPSSSTSNNFYPNPNTVGGPLNPPTAVKANNGNNVYNKVYFSSAPVTPQCSHASNP